MSTAKKAAADDSASVDTEARIIPVEYIERRIYPLREQKVMLDFDLADLYQPTSNLHGTWTKSKLASPSN
jgi:hypothetical protein